jgi:hypothetical protein
MLDSLRAEVESSASGLTETQWKWSPSADRWCLAQILDHLNKTGNAVLPCFAKALAELRQRDARSEGPFRYGTFDRFTMRALSANPPFKMPVPPALIPAASGSGAQILAEFLTLQDSLRKVVEDANGYDLAAVKVTSPLNRMFRLRFGAYLESTLTHQQYHWLQAQELLKNPDFPR